MKHRAFSLVEVLVVIAIVVLIAALLLPALISAKGASKQAPCRSNLRQLQVSWLLYSEQNEGQWPLYLEQFALAYGKQGILQCPGDTFGGANRKLTSVLGTPVSYYYLMPIPEFRQDLGEADENHGILYCVAHGHAAGPNPSGDPVNDTNGLVLRANRDGSIKGAPVNHLCSEMTDNGMIRGRPEWTLLTEKRPCPPRWCLGASVSCD